MQCRWAQRNIAAYIDGELGAASRWAIRLHLERCADCFDRYDRREGVDPLAARVPPPVPPKSLRTEIRVALSREMARGGWDKAWERFKLRLREAMEPLAIRAIGGILAAIVLFGGVMPDLWSMRPSTVDDIPLTYLARRLVAGPSLSAPAPYPLSQPTTVLAYIDMHGEAYAFDLPEDQRYDVQLRAEVANALLLSQFEPAMRFGRPVPGRVLIAFVRTTVRG